MKIQITHELDQITLKPGEMFTIWLDLEKNIGRRDALQVELRVRTDGIPEIFTHTNQIKLQDFTEWKLDNKT